MKKSLTFVASLLCTANLTANSQAGTTPSFQPEATTQPMNTITPAVAPYVKDGV